MLRAPLSDWNHVCCVARPLNRLGIRCEETSLELELDICADGKSMEQMMDFRKTWQRLRAGLKLCVSWYRYGEFFLVADLPEYL